MTVRQPRYSKEEFARRGDEIYESQVRPQAPKLRKVIMAELWRSTSKLERLSLPTIR